MARTIGFWWGFAEGLFFFIVPDVYITAATLYSIRAGAIAWVSSIAGSLVAVAGIFMLIAGFGVDYPAFLELVPGIYPGLIRNIAQSLTAEGLPYSLFLVSGGVPLKLYVGTATSLGTSFLSILLWTVFARIVRIAPVYALAAAARLLFRRRIDAGPVRWLVALGLLWTGFYVFYFIRMGQV